MNNYEKDPVLGLEIAKILAKLGLDNPITKKMDKSKIASSIKELLDGLGISLKDDSIAKTPKRVADFFISELFYGLDYNNFPKVSFTENKYNYHEPVIARNISFNSTCEHHLVAISGEACIAYIPKGQVMGLSKINRIADFFASRPQVQERATMQIFHTLQHILKAEDIAVIIKARHHCVTSRGIHDHNAENITYQFGGKFADSELRRDFIKLVMEEK